MSHSQQPLAAPEPPAAEPQPFNVLEHLATQEINPQSASPLYSSIPLEVRTLIFQYAMTESQNRKPPRDFDFRVQHDHGPEDPPLPIINELTQHVNTVRHRRFANFRSRLPKGGYDWYRPDNGGIISIALLQTCRRAYIETHSLPQLQKEHEFYRYRGPSETTQYGAQRCAIHRYFADKLNSPAPVPGLCRRDLVRCVRIFAQMFWLDDTNDEFGFWRLVTETPWLKPVEHLRLTIRRGDWWYWEQEQPLKINPFRGNAEIRQTLLDMQTGDGNPAFQAPVWGLAFQHLPNLKTLTMEFETAEYKKKELENIVAWAVKWRFPLTNGKHLSAAGQAVEKMSYRGSAHNWSDSCEQCDGRSLQCEHCIERYRSIADGYGPRLYLWSVTWKPVSDGAVNRLV
jgi:hypothetical protein